MALVCAPDDPIHQFAWNPLGAAKLRPIRFGGHLDGIGPVFFGGVKVLLNRFQEFRNGPFDRFVVGNDIKIQAMGCKRANVRVLRRINNDWEMNRDFPHNLSFPLWFVPSSPVDGYRRVSATIFR